jgi:hypothetical protein
MDAKRLWGGAHSPMIRLDGSTPRGISQAGLGLRQGKQYSPAIRESLPKRA